MLALTRWLIDELAERPESKDANFAHADLPPRCTSAAARQRKKRQRARDGLRILRMACNYDPLVLYLIETQRITESDALDHAKVEIAAAQVLDDLPKRFFAGLR
jgi:hypothetical protein